MSAIGGSDDDPKKTSTVVNRIKKTSIKRKVPNFSHDSDDAIVEPLLQTESECSVVANNSAKYLLNKSKTDCPYENDTKPVENPRVSIPVSSANDGTNNIVSEDRSSPSSTSETEPIYNHMNVNILSGFDLEKLNIPEGNSILIEIDGSGAVCHGPSPLIFTTAKIHADTKAKVMELFQVTPMPIISTIEGEVKTGANRGDDKRNSNLHTNKYDVSKNEDNKSDFKLEPKKEIGNFNEVLTNEALSNSIQIKNQQNIKKEIDTQDPFEKSAKIFSKDQKVSLKEGNAMSVDPKSPISKVTSDVALTTKAKPTTATATCKVKGGVISDTSKRLIGTDSKSIKSDKNNITDKSKGLSDNKTMNSNKISHPGESSNKQNNKSNVNTTQSDKMDSNQSVSTSNKKLQRQKNASIEEIKEINYKDLNNIPTVKNIAILDKPVSNPLDIKSDSATLYKASTPITTGTAKGSTPIVTSGIPSKSLNSSSINPSFCKSSVTTGTSVSINGKPLAETVKTKPAPTRIPEPSVKTAMKSPSNTGIVTTATSSKTSTTSTAKSTKVTDDRSFAKQDFTSVSVLPSKKIKTDQTTTSAVASALPLYIVSTSKTKIGSSSTPSISTVTKKTLEQKPITETADPDGKSGKLVMSTSSSQSNQSSSKPKITDVDKKDDRA